MSEKIDYLLISDDGPGFKTIEGEGHNVGKPSIFVRLFGCNLTCKAWSSVDSPFGCDSFVSWSKKNKYTFDQIFEHFEKNNFVSDLASGLVILKITGGEPMLRQQPLIDFIEEFKRRYEFYPVIDFETNSTIMPKPYWLDIGATFTTAPKLSNNGDAVEKTYKPEVLRFHKDNRSCFKFVVKDEKDLDEINEKFINALGLDRANVWLMPCCGSRQEHIEIAERVAEWAKQHNLNFSPRLQLLIWDKALRV